MKVVIVPGRTSSARSQRREHRKDIPKLGVMPTARVTSTGVQSTSSVLVEVEVDLQNRDDPLPVLPAHLLHELDARDEVARAARAEE